jgi:uncharacterized YkwD family protein/spore coat assembly protein SafA
MKNIIKSAVLTVMFCLAFAVTVFAATETYTVRKGDSLWIIANKYQVGISEIISANPQFRNPDLIYPGDKVIIPLMDAGTLSIEEEVINLCNAERTRYGLQPLKINWEVSRVARYKSTDMRDGNYFSHMSPSYGSPFDMLQKFNISYKTAGENIAKGQKTAASVVNAWMNSEGHRANILNSGFSEIGVGYVEGNGGPYWTQMFIKS